ncbi:MAG: diacylglycerol kinase family protein [Gelidibacter sp.]
MLHIHFIVNPIAGSGRSCFSEALLLDYFEAVKYTITTKYSDFKGHAIDLTKASIKQQAHIIVACGGDGTINEVAATLVGTSISLGIVPIGSGNGLATNLGIPKNIKKALNIIKNNQSTKIDSGYVNQQCFFSNSGFGFTANVIKNYEAFQKRTILCYLKAVLKSFLEFSKREQIIISIDGGLDLVNPFMIFISNSNVMGYHMSLTPKASLKDGLLDVMIIPKISRFKMLFFGICMLIRKPHLLKEVTYYQTNALTLIRKKGESFDAQIDGESVGRMDSELTVSVKRDSLNVLV